MLSKDSTYPQQDINNTTGWGPELEGFDEEQIIEHIMAESELMDPNLERIAPNENNLNEEQMIVEHVLAESELMHRNANNSIHPPFKSDPFLQDGFDDEQLVEHILAETDLTHEVWEELPYYEPPPLIERRKLDDELSKRMEWKAVPGKVSMFREERPRYILYTPFPKSTQQMSGLSEEQRIEEGKNLLQLRLALLKMEVVEMAEDGNCQFRAFSMEFYGTQEFHMAGPACL